MFRRLIRIPIESLRCKLCGGVLDRNLKCGYCGTLHQQIGEELNIAKLCVKHSIIYVTKCPKCEKERLSHIQFLEMQQKLSKKSDRHE